VWTKAASCDQGSAQRIERVVEDRLFEGEETVLYLTGWVGRPRLRGRFVDRPRSGP
jgi:hypothetical protein